MKNPFVYREKKETAFVLSEDELTAKNNDEKSDERRLFGYYRQDMTLLKNEFGYSESGDVKLREFTVRVDSKNVDACVFYIDGLINKAYLNNSVLFPMMIHSRDIELKNVREIPDVLMPEAELSEEDRIEKLKYDINFGSAIMLINGLEKAIELDIKGWKSKPIGEPQTEKVIRGPNDAFNEQLRANTALIRRLVRNSNLVVSETKIGKISHTPCSVIYMKNIASDSLANEIIRRVENLDIDYIMTAGELEMYIEDETFSAIPQFLSTERPDRTAKAILDGKIAIIVDGSPFALLAPVTFSELNESVEDSYLRVPYANLLRIVRSVSFLLSMFLPGIYIAIMNFHNELLPTNLMLAIIAEKEEVPFPGLIELIFMEIALEIIREAGIRVPTPSGTTLSIVGALILGQAAVEAGLVSPVVIIIVSLSAIGSLATPNYYLGLSARVMKFVYIILGGFWGLLGITTGMFVHMLLWVHTYSVGVPVFSPYAPRTARRGFFGIFSAPVWKKERRDDFQNPKRKYKEAKISRKWKYH